MNREEDRAFKQWISSVIGPATWRHRMLADGSVTELILSFSARHRPKAGWLVYQSVMETDEAGLSLLPIFLKLQCPRALVRQDIRPALILHDYRSAKLINYMERPHRRSGPGFSDRFWYGRIDLVWHGVPIHFQRHFLPAGGPNGDYLTLIGTKSRKAMVDLWQRLRRFWKSTYRGQDEIIVTAGGTMAKPQTRWEDLVLPPGMAEDIRQNVEAFFAARKHYESLNLPYRRGFLFCGPPGTGKSSVAKAIIANTKATSLVLPLREDMQDVQVESAFRQAANESPSILLVEDLDKLTTLSRVSMPFLLGLLDGIDSYQGFIIVATTNEPEKVDRALLHRPSRFDRIWHFGFPGLAERREILARKGQGRFSDAAIAKAAEDATGFTPAYTQEIVVSALLQALHQGREPGDDDLRTSVERLRQQCKTSQKATGAIPNLGKVGFSTNGAGQ